MKKVLFVLMCTVLCFGCNKMDPDVNTDNILGIWVDDYSDYPYFAPEGYSTYTFKQDGKVDIHLYDVFAGESDKQMSYWVEDEVIQFDGGSGQSGESFTIVKLTKNGMEWQRIGTTFSKGTVGSDFKHFVRRSK